jgi:vacuolar-type H+-ATPase catalytic subunit A/Vma1
VLDEQQRQSGYDKDISKRTFERVKMKAPEFIKKNVRATNSWFRWIERTGRMCIPGDFIAGNTVVYKKINEKKEGETLKQ